MACLYLHLTKYFAITGNDFPALGSGAPAASKPAEGGSEGGGGGGSGSQAWGSQLADVVKGTAKMKLDSTSQQSGVERRTSESVASNRGDPEPGGGAGGGGGSGSHHGSHSSHGSHSHHHSSSHHHSNTNVIPSVSSSSSNTRSSSSQQHAK